MIIKIVVKQKDVPMIVEYLKPGNDALSDLAKQIERAYNLDKQAKDTKRLNARVDRKAKRAGL